MLGPLGVPALPAHCPSAGLELEPKHGLVSVQACLTVSPHQWGCVRASRLTHWSLWVHVCQRWHYHPHSVGSKLPQAHIYWHLWHAASVMKSWP